MVLGMAGNTGTQSLAVTIRLLSDKDDSKNKLTKALFKELRIGFSNGLVLASLAFLCVLGFLYFTNQGVAEEFFVLNDCLKGAAIVACSLLIAMTISSFVGAMIPILFSKIKIDPAVASGPFITTINDITALLTYYGLAIIFFSIML
jgi:magnesium transporter